MFHTALFATIGVVIGLFAFEAARAHQFLIAVPAAIIVVWLLDMSRQSLVRERQKRAASRLLEPHDADER